MIPFYFSKIQYLRLLFVAMSCQEIEYEEISFL